MLGHLPFLRPQFPYLRKKGAGRDDLFYLCQSEVIHDTLAFLFVLPAKNGTDARKAREIPTPVLTLISSLGTTTLSHWEKLRV